MVNGSAEINANCGITDETDMLEVITRTTKVLETTSSRQ